MPNQIQTPAKPGAPKNARPTRALTLDDSTQTDRACADSIAAVLRGDYFAVVFCGRRDRLLTLAGECTAALYKFVLSDERLANEDDFARADGFGLPTWPADRIKPLEGVCFVFATGDEPALDLLRTNGGIAGEHWVTAHEGDVDRESDRRRFALKRFVKELHKAGHIALLGYGHQGATMAALLRHEFAIASDRLRIVDDNAESQRRAQRDGLRMAANAAEINNACGVIYTPLSRYPKLWAMVDAAKTCGACIFDNSHRGGNKQQFQFRGKLHFDAAAFRALRPEGTRIRLNDHGLPVPCHVVRQDWRRFGSIHVRHMHSAPPVCLQRHTDEYDVESPNLLDGFDRSTWEGMERAFVSLRGGPDLGFFAAQQLCDELWPNATREVFPSTHVMDLGRSAFERHLLAHLNNREIVSTMQTPAQRVTLGIAARHYAADRPIIEIGSAYGGSALHMAAATDSSDSPIYSIDPDAPTRDIMRFAFEREGYSKRLRQIVEPSESAISQLAHLHGLAGLALIDGLHTQTAVLSDFDLYWPLVAMGGAMVFHDVTPALHGVFSAVMKRVLHDRRFEAKCLVDGLLVLERT